MHRGEGGKGLLVLSLHGLVASPLFFRRRGAPIKSNVLPSGRGRHHRGKKKRRERRLLLPPSNDHQHVTFQDEEEEEGGKRGQKRETEGKPRSAHPGPNLLVVARVELK